VLIVRLSTLGLDILLDSIDLGLVFDKLLLNIVQPVVDITGENRVLLGVVLDRVVSYLFSQTILVDLQEVPDVSESHLFLVKLSLDIISFGEFVRNIVVHLVNLFLSLLHFLVNSELKTLDLLEILIDVIFLNL